VHRAPQTPTGGGRVKPLVELIGLARNGGDRGEQRVSPPVVAKPFFHR
jgi:hypothetical protein